MFQVSFRAAFPHEQVQPETQLLARFLELGALVIGADAGQRIGVQIFPAQSRRMPIDHLAAAGVDLGQLAFVTEKYAWIIHQLRHACDAIVRHHEGEIVGGKTRARCFQMRRRHARRQHDKKIDRQIFARFEHVTDSVHAEDVRVFVGIDDHRARAMRDHRARKFRYRDHRAFDVEMAVDQTGREISAADVDDFPRFIIAEADHTAVVHRDVCFVNLGAQDVDELRILEK